jgi:hypothetical protein
MRAKKPHIKIIRELVDESKIEVIAIVRAEYRGGYKIHLWFSDGKNHIVDFEPFLMSARNPMSAQYRDLEKFRQFRLVYGNAATQDVREKPAVPIPLHLRNAPTPLMAQQGYGIEYKYPHVFPGHFVEQNYLPENLADALYYRPTTNGAEAAIGERLRRWWGNIEIKGLHHR